MSVPDSKGLSTEPDGCDEPCNEQDELERVRKLLFASDRARLEAGLARLDKIEKRLSHPVTRAQDASEVLIPAIHIRLNSGDE